MCGCRSIAAYRPDLSRPLLAWPASVDRWASGPRVQCSVFIVQCLQRHLLTMLEFTVNTQVAGVWWVDKAGHVGSG